MRPTASIRGSIKPVGCTAVDFGQILLAARAHARALARALSSCVTAVTASGVASTLAQPTGGPAPPCTLPLDVPEGPIRDPCGTSAGPLRADVKYDLEVTEPRGAMGPVTIWSRRARPCAAVHSAAARRRYVFFCHFPLGVEGARYWCVATSVLRGRSGT